MEKSVQKVKALLILIKKLLEQSIDNIELVLAIGGILLLVYTSWGVFLEGTITIGLIIGLMLWVVFSVIILIESHLSRLKKRRANKVRRDRQR